MVRRITRDLHTHRLIESLACESRLQVPLHRRCLPECSHATSITRDIETSFVDHHPCSRCFLLPFFLRGGGGFRTQTLLSVRQFIEDAEKECITHDDTHDAELEVKDTTETGAEQRKLSQQEAIKALRMLFEDFEAQIKWQNEVDDDEENSGDSQEEFPIEDQAAEPLTSFASTLSPQEYEDALSDLECMRRYLGRMPPQHHCQPDSFSLPSPMSMVDLLGGKLDLLFVAIFKRRIQNSRLPRLRVIIH